MELAATLNLICQVLMRQTLGVEVDVGVDVAAIVVICNYLNYISCSTVDFRIKRIQANHNAHILRQNTGVTLCGLFFSKTSACLPFAIFILVFLPLSWHTGYESGKEKEVQKEGILLYCRSESHNKN